MTNLIHSDLIARARRWLQNKGCSVVITELTTSAREIPDAIGWDTRISYVIEAKVSLSDFHNDRKKALHQNDNFGVFGNNRYYITPPNLLAVDKIPDPWGLLEVHGKTIRIIKPCTYIPSINLDRTQEIILLISALRRMVGNKEVKGINCKTYTFGNIESGRASIGVQEELQENYKCQQ